MKAIYFSVLASGAAVALAGCSGLRLSDTNALADDVYYDGEPSKDIATAPASRMAVSQSDVDSYDRRVAAYSSGRGSSSLETRDFSQIQQYYANAGSTNGAAGDETSAEGIKVTEVSADNPDSGYWVDGFSGSDSDQSYAERIIRFHRPLVSVNYYSPFFQSARMSGDWNIYVDGYGSTYMVPTWTNPWYDDFYYGGLAYDWRWGRAGWYLGWNWGGWSFGWANDWNYWAWGGWGWPHHHHGWCDPWGIPHHYHGFHDHWHGGGDHHHPDYIHRPVYASRANVVNHTYSGTRQRDVTTNPNAARAAQRYRQEIGSGSRVSRSYTRDVRSDYSTSARASETYRSNVRRSGEPQFIGGTTNGSQRMSSASSNSRRSSSAMTSSQPSRSSYTPSYSNNRGGRSSYSSSERRVSTSGFNSRRSSSTSSSYAPSSRSQQRPSYSGMPNSRSSSRPSSSFSGGRSSGSFSGGSRSSGGGARSGGRPR